MNNILFFDVETTGLDPDKNSIIQIAAQYYKNGTKVSEFETKIAPYTDSIAIGALAVNKTTIKQLAEYPNSKVATDQFVEYLCSLEDKFTYYTKVIPAAHNATFDISFLKNLLSFHGYSGWDNIFSHRTIDTATIARFLIDAGLLDCKNASLGVVAEALGIQVNEDNQHEAMYDTELCAVVYFTMLDLIKGRFSLEPQERAWS